MCSASHTQQAEPSCIKFLANSASASPTLKDYSALSIVSLVAMDETFFYELSLPDALGGIVNFEQLRNKVVLIVNVASLCGFAPQYIELQQLYEKYEKLGLRILAFPCNQFNDQEPQSGEQIVNHVRKSFGVKFTIMQKVLVNGHDEAPIYTYLKSHQRNEFGFRGVKWNFEKFLVDKRGHVTNRFPSSVTPLQFESILKELLGVEKDASMVAAEKVDT